MATPNTSRRLWSTWGPVDVSSFCTLLHDVSDCLCSFFPHVVCGYFSKDDYWRSTRHLLQFDRRCPVSSGGALPLRVSEQSAKHYEEGRITRERELDQNFWWTLDLCALLSCRISWTWTIVTTQRFFSRSCSLPLSFYTMRSLLVYLLQVWPLTPCNGLFKTDMQHHLSHISSLNWTWWLSFHAKREKWSTCTESKWVCFICDRMAIMSKLPCWCLFVVAYVWCFLIFSWVVLYCNTQVQI